METGLDPICPLYEPMKHLAAALLLVATASPDPVPDLDELPVYCWPCEPKVMTADAPDPCELPPQCIPCIEPIWIARADSEPLAGQIRAIAEASGVVSGGGWVPALKESTKALPLTGGKSAAMTLRETLFFLPTHTKGTKMTSYKPKKRIPKWVRKQPWKGPEWAAGITAAKALLGERPNDWNERAIRESGARRANGSIHMPTAWQWFNDNFEKLNDEYSGTDGHFYL